MHIWNILHDWYFCIECNFFISERIRRFNTSSTSIQWYFTAVLIRFFNLIKDKIITYHIYINFCLMLFERFMKKLSITTSAVYFPTVKKQGSSHKRISLYSTLSFKKLTITLITGLHFYVLNDSFNWLIDSLKSKQISMRYASTDNFFL